MANRAYPINDSLVGFFWNELRTTTKFKFSNQTSVNDLDAEIDRISNRDKKDRRISKNEKTRRGLMFNIKKKNPEEFRQRMAVMLGNFYNSMQAGKVVKTKTKGQVEYFRRNMKWNETDIKFLQNLKVRTSSDAVKEYYRTYELSSRTPSSIRTKYLRLRRHAA